MEVLGRLAGTIIHDLNNLLTVIQLNAGLIQIGGLEEDEVLAAAGKIDEASSRAAELTRKVLNFARDQADEIGAVNLQELIDGLSRLLEPLVARRVHLIVDPGPRELWAQGNRSAIEQAIMNLVLNAVDTMPAGGSVTISLAEREIVQGNRKSCSPGKYVVISVADEGPGIPHDAQARVFEPFFTTKNSGTGMGLAIVNRIARYHGGKVEFESEPGHGTTFRLWLPEGEMPCGEAIRPASAVDVPLDRTVLLVEDDRGILELTRYLLQTAGLRVFSAETGEDALALWQAHRGEVDLLFTDIVLSGAISGRDLALKILADKPSLPVLYTSGYSSGGHEQAYITKANFLPKPFEPDALQCAVRDALAGS